MSDYGLLLNTDTKLHRSYFEEMTKMLGVRVGYQYPLKSKTYNLNGELVAHYSDLEYIYCIFNDHIDNKTAKMMGWNSELVKDAALISVPYDLENLQIGCLFNIPEALDTRGKRLFRAVELSTIQIYPASVTCRLVQEYVDTMSMSDVTNFVATNFNLLNEG